MAQLKMYRLPGPGPEIQLPEGYTISNYRTEKDKLDWVECCKNGLVSDNATPEDFDNCITNRADIDLFTDVFFLDYKGEHIGTFTAYEIKASHIGDYHMVGIRTDFRGKGLAKILCAECIRHLEEKHVTRIELTTDEWRKGAVKAYLNAGFRPVEYDVGMEERWQGVLEEIGVDSVEMLQDDATPYKTIYRKGLEK